MNTASSSTSKHPIQAEQQLLALLLKDKEHYSRFVNSHGADIGGSGELWEESLRPLWRAMCQQYKDGYFLTRESFIEILPSLGIKLKLDKIAQELVFANVSFRPVNVNDYSMYVNQVMDGSLNRRFIEAAKRLLELKNLTNEEENYAAAMVKDFPNLDKDNKLKALAEIESFPHNNHNKPVKCIKIERFSDECITETEWLWYGKIPMGNLTLIAGEGKCGKSQITSYLAATVSTGRAWTDKAPCSAGAVIMVNAEDSMATMGARLKAAGANLQNIMRVEVVGTRVNGKITERAFTLDDIDGLEARLLKDSIIKMIVIDPIGAVMAGADTNRDSDVRGMISPLKTLAEKYNVAVVLVAHTGKVKNVKSRHRVLGSVGFVNACRSVFIAVQHPNEDSFIFDHEACNLAKESKGLKYKVEGAVVIGKDNQSIETSKITWLGETDITADEAMAEADIPLTKIDEAKELLVELLGDGSAKYAHEIYKVAEGRGISAPSVRKAKLKLNISDKKQGYGSGRSIWFMNNDNSGSDKGKDNSCDNADNGGNHTVQA